MNTVELGLLVSAVIVVFLIFLFRFEAKRGLRIADRIRTRLDFFVLQIVHSVHVSARLFFRKVLKQSVHFIVHTLLISILSTIKSFERRVTHMMRSNKSRAISSERKSKERNKLEEIAIHKLEVALSEEEKEKHKEAVLQGK